MCIRDRFYILLGRTAAKHNFPHQRTSAHTKFPLFTCRASAFHPIPEFFKFQAIPRFLYGIRPQGNLIFPFLIKTARRHLHILSLIHIFHKFFMKNPPPFPSSETNLIYLYYIKRNPLVKFL